MLYVQRLTVRFEPQPGFVARAGERGDARGHVAMAPGRKGKGLYGSHPLIESCEYPVAPHVFCATLYA